MTRSYHNKILRVNLSTGEITVDAPGTAYFRSYMGGWNIIGDVLLKEVPAKADPLGPENKLIFAPGVLTGLPFSGASRNAVGGKSPLTGAFGAAEVGGYFGAEFKRAGFDALIVEGVAEKPVYLWIKDGEVEIRDASELWGKSTKETLETLRETTGERRLACSMIGPGGENMVRYACVMNETKDAAGRTGMGAVMGSKKLKAVAVRSNNNLEPADKDKIREMAQYLSSGVRAGELAESMAKYGTGVHIEDMIPTGNLPIRNFRDGEFPGAANISANTIVDTLGIGMEGCYACAVRCKKVVEVKDGPYPVDPTYGGPEYETIASLGSCVGVDDARAVSHYNQLCNAYSLDTISTGVAIAFAMECYENGLLTKEDTDGLDLRFGNAEVVAPLIEKIARREGIGALLADGVQRAAERVGKGSAQFAMHAKGQEYPMHEPRFKRGLAIGYAVSPTGADHCHSLHDSGMATGDEEGLLPPGKLSSLGVIEPMPVESLGPEKVRATLYNQVVSAMGNCLPMCLFVPWTLEQHVELVNAATGWDTTTYELMKVGERAWNLARVFNAREGLTPDDDRLAERSYGPTTGGALADGGIDREVLREAVDQHYQMMGWDADGVPTEGRLRELDIGWAAQHLPKE